MNAFWSSYAVAGSVWLIYSIIFISPKAALFLGGAMVVAALAIGFAVAALRF